MSTPEQSTDPAPIDEIEPSEVLDPPTGPPERETLDYPELNERGQWTPIPETTSE